jgi:hypothetical protein
LVFPCKTHSEINFYINHVTGATINHPFTSRARSSIEKFSSRKRVHDLINTWSIQPNFLVIRVAHLHERVDVVPTSLGLKSKFSTGISKRFDKISRLLFITLSLVVDLEGWSSMQDERRGDTRVSGAMNRDQ